MGFEQSNIIFNLIWIFKCFQQIWFDLIWFRILVKYLIWFDLIWIFLFDLIWLSNLIWFDYLIWLDCQIFSQIFDLIWFELASSSLIWFEFEDSPNILFDLIWISSSLTKFDLIWFDWWNYDLNISRKILHQCFKNCMVYLVN